MGIALTVWFFALSAGAIYGYWYEFKPTETGPVPATWPHASPLQLDPNRPTLLVFIHPHCPCTRATLEELARLMTRCKDRVCAQAVFLKPESSEENWAKSSLWRKAEAIPGVAVAEDVGGTEQSRFNARVSGEVLVYAPDGNLKFHGGITISRGHVGENAGRASIEEFLQSGRLALAETRTFGCPLESRHCCESHDGESCNAGDGQ